MIKCIIVEDSQLAIEKLERFIGQLKVLELVDTFTNGLDAINFLTENTVDLIFLDIYMEGMDGLEFMDSLFNHPQIVLVSAYSEYAIEGFENNVTDYLIKPYSFERFGKAVDKVQSALSKQKSQKTYMFVKTEYRLERIDFSDILYIESIGAYMQIVTLHSKIMTLLNFSQIQSLLPNNNFIRVHRSYIVAIDKIQSIERNVIKIGKKQITITKTYQLEFYDRLGFKN